jgi:hypothetical protein
MIMLCSVPSGAKRFCSSLSDTKPRRLKLKRDQCVPSFAVQIETWPWRETPLLDVSVQTFASAGGLASWSSGICAEAGATKSMVARNAALRIMVFPENVPGLTAT